MFGAQRHFSFPVTALRRPHSVDVPLGTLASNSTDISDCSLLFTLSLESTETFLYFYLLVFILCSSSFSLKGNSSSYSICLSPKAVPVRSIPVNIWQIYRNIDHVLTFATYTKKKALFHLVKHHITPIFFLMHRSINSQIHGMPVLQLLQSHIGYG